MPEITAQMVKELRDATNVSMMDCKRALAESDGDMEKASRLLREKGLAVAAKRAAKATNQGVIASVVTPDGRVASLVEVNCETDFVARNDLFKAFANRMAARACATDGSLADEARDDLAAQIAAIGENMLIRRNLRYQLAGEGRVGSYIHLGGKVAVLIEVNCTKPATATQPAFKEVVSDLTLHVAACSPQYLKPEEVPAATLQAEREIYAKQVEGKPAQIVDKIVDGKIKKFYSDICLLQQPFVKEQKMSVTDLLQQVGKQLGDTLTVRRFVRFQLGA